MGHENCNMRLGAIGHRNGCLHCRLLLISQTDESVVLDTTPE